MLQDKGLTEVADAVSAEANSAFVSAVHWGVLTAAAATAIGVVMVLFFLPARARAEDVQEQEEEFVGEHVADLLTE
jgi:Na+/H+-dicarboxylate symporter